MQRVVVGGLWWLFVVGGLFHYPAETCCCIVGAEGGGVGGGGREGGRGEDGSARTSVRAATLGSNYGSNLLFQLVTMYWHRANQSQHGSYCHRRLEV